MKNKVNLAILALFVVVVGLMTMTIAFEQDAQASPPAAPTPVANLTQTEKGRFFRFQPATAITADTNTSGVEVLDFDFLDVSYTVDQIDGAVPNTTTLTIQYSNDNTNWDDGVAIGSALTVDATDITRVPVFGRYMRIEQDVTNSNTLTFTLLAVGR